MSARTKHTGKIPPRPLAILLEIAIAHEVTVAEVLAGRQFPTLVAVRREACRRFRYELQYSTTKIGQMLNLHHTTVIQHLKNRQPYDFSQPDESGIWNI